MENWKSRQIRIIKNRDGEFCRYCGKPALETIHLEHITPKSRGGGNHITNLGISCPTCNMRKNMFTADEFRDLMPERMVKRFDSNVTDALGYLFDYLSPDECQEIYLAYRAFTDKVLSANVRFWYENADGE